MIDAELKIALTLQGPFMTQSSNVGGFGVDAPIARKDGVCCIPGTLLKGKLREAWTELLAAVNPQVTAFSPDVDKLLGKASGSHGDAGSWSPLRGQLLFSDLIEDRERPFRSTFRIRIDERRGSVDRGAYLTMETPHPAGEPIHFSGEIRFLASDADEVFHICRDVKVGLKWIASFGAERSIGFGRVKAVAVDIARQETVQIRTSSEEGGQPIGLAIRPAEPFCIGLRRVSDNLFESDVVIPGGVIKGCVAATWASHLGKDPKQPVIAGFDDTRPELCEWFDRVRFLHAFPSEERGEGRPVAMPMSLVTAERENGQFDLYDLARCASPCLIHEQAPRFQVDWKDKHRKHASQTFGHPALQHQLRVRTAMDSKKRRAMDEQLFAYDMIVPEGRVWLSEVDFSAVDPAVKAKVAQQLQPLLALGLRALGKTKARAACALGRVQRRFESSLETLGGEWTVTLQTPALLCDPRTLHGAADQAETHAAYQKTWEALSNGILQLDRFYAAQSLAGGEYVYHRFLGGKTYYPFLLTDPGSVFVLKTTANAATARPIIEKWLRSGLPLPEWAHDTYGNGLRLDWHTCPYVPENGFGEVAVNLSCHEKLAPKEAYEPL